MPRQPRYFLPDIPQHVLMRGVDKQATFFAADDYALFLNVLHDTACETECALHAYVLMTNHVHLLLTPGHARALPRLIQGLGRSYVQAVNRRYERTGTLWQGRYKACLVQTDGYLMACQRYIELNPVRAGMVPDPADYPYSSYRHHALGSYDPALTPHSVYCSLASTERERQRAYRRLFETSLERTLIDRIRRDTNACRVLGNELFTDQIGRMLNRRVRPARIGRPKTHTTQ